MTFCEWLLWEICIPRIVQAEEILIGCFVECQSIKKVGGRCSIEELYQALFFVLPVPPECFTSSETKMSLITGCDDGGGGGSHSDDDVGIDGGTAAADDDGGGGDGGSHGDDGVDVGDDDDDDDDDDDSGNCGSDSAAADNDHVN